MLLNQLKRIRPQGETLILQTRVLGAKDGIGNPTKTWVDGIEIIGVINVLEEKQESDIEGDYDTSAKRMTQAYIGYFMPFDIPDTQDCRIKRVFQDKSVEIYQIVEFNKNLYYKNKQHHVEARLKVVKQ
jgi:hypothetical protein